MRVDIALCHMGNGVMGSLTQMISDRTSPVAQWMRERFPDPKPWLAALRAEAGTTVIMPPKGIAHTTQGGAIDWWLRFLAVPGQTPDLGVARQGADELEGHAAYDAAWPLVTVATGIDFGNGMKLEFDEPADAMRDFLDRDDEYQARACFALSLLTECFRAGVRPGSRLLTIPEGSSPQALLDLATADEVADLIAMRDSARRVFVPKLPEGPIRTGPTFDGSQYLPADADLIAGDTLVEIKATIGGPPRKNGTRAIKFDRDDVYQLIGYFLMDFSDKYGLRQVALYAPRFEFFGTWPVDWFLGSIAGREVDIAASRAEFKTVLTETLPPYISDKYGVDWAAMRDLPPD